MKMAGPRHERGRPSIQPAVEAGIMDHTDATSGFNAQAWAAQFDAEHERKRQAPSSNGQPSSADAAGKKAPSNNGRPDGKQKAASPSPVPAGAIILGADEHCIVEAVTARLAARDTELYQRGGQLVRLSRPTKPPSSSDRLRHSGAPRIEPLPLAVLRTRIAKHCHLVGHRRGEPHHAAPPDWLVKATGAQAMPWHGIRPLEGVTETPLLRPDGTILQAAGFDSATGILFEPTTALEPIPKTPTRDDAIKARDALLEVIADFPMAEPMHRAAWLASLLTPLARPAFEGPAPLFLTDANIRGCGKGLSASCASIISTGRPFATAIYSHEPAEMRKVITAIALAGEPLVMLDNVAGAFGNSSLDAALTSTEWNDRILGKSESPRLPLLSTWYATANNCLIAADTARRVCHIRIESRDERPEERDGFQHPDLLGWVRRERTRLLRAALTCLAAYCVGRPTQKMKPWGSFEGWSDLVRQCVVWLDLPDPADTRIALAEEADQEVKLLRALMAVWEAVAPECESIRVSMAIQRLKDGPDGLQPHRDAMMSLIPARDGGLPTGKQLGSALGRFKGRVYDGRYFESREDRKGFCEWRLIGQK
jgi:hypothetical protein